jgi:predicted DNA-binding protein
MPTTTVRIGERARQALKELSDQTGKPMGTLIEDMLERYRRERLLDEFNAAYAALRADPEAWEEELQERRAWDSTLMDGLRDEGEY